MNKTIETAFQTPFGELKKRTSYIPQDIKVSGGVYFSDVALAEDSLVVEELIRLYKSGQTYGEIYINDKCLSFDILFEFTDTSGNKFPIHRISDSALKQLFFNEIMELDNNSVDFFDKTTQYIFKGKIIYTE